MSPIVGEENDRPPWGLLSRLRKPKPVPPVIPPRPRTVFESRGLLTSYGMVPAPGATNGDLPAAAVCEKAKAAGYSYVAGQFYPENEPFLAGLRAECHARGLKFGVWDAEPSPERAGRIAGLQPDLVILESEGAYTDWRFVAFTLNKYLPGVPWAVVTNLSGLDDHVLQQAGSVLLTECYQQDNPNATPARMEAAARARGYQTVVPCVGVYHNYALGNYLPLDCYCVYTAEYMSDTDWMAAK